MILDGIPVTFLDPRVPAHEFQNEGAVLLTHLLEDFPEPSEVIFTFLLIRVDVNLDMCLESRNSNQGL